MDTDFDIPITATTLDDISQRVRRALQRHPLCRNVEFEIIRVSRRAIKCNWTISMRAVDAAGLWEASDIVKDIQEAYILAAAA